MMNKTLILCAILALTGCGKHWVITDRSNPADANYWTLQDAIDNRESYIVPEQPQAAQTAQVLPQQTITPQTPPQQPTAAQAAPVVHEEQQQQPAMQDEEKHDEHEEEHKKMIEKENDHDD